MGGFSDHHETLKSVTQSHWNTFAHHSQLQDVPVFMYLLACLWDGLEGF